MEGCNQWALADDFMQAINDHREMCMSPSDLICVDEGMSRWYGHVVDWVYDGFPTNRAIDKKPENGCDINTSACGPRGILLRLEIFDSPIDDEVRTSLYRDVTWHSSHISPCRTSDSYKQYCMCRLMFCIS